MVMVRMKWSIKVEEEEEQDEEEEVVETVDEMKMKEVMMRRWIEEVEMKERRHSEN